MSTNIPRISPRFQTTPVSNLSAGATTFSLASSTDKYGVALSGLYGFVIDEGQSAEEFFIGSVSAGVVSSIQTITVGSDPLNSLATGLQQAHRKSATVKITDYPLLAYLREMINGNASYTLDNILSYTSGPTFTSANQIITKAYADALTFAGAPNASTSVKGIVQEATAAQINSGTATGSTGAILTVTPDQLALSNLALAAAGNNTSIAVGSGNKLVTQTGLQNKTETWNNSTGSANAYVLTLSPAPTAYAAGQELEFTANFTNTGAATLNVNSLGAIAIKKVDGTVALASGDIASGMTYKVKYYGAVFQLLTPISNVVTTAYTTGFGAWTTATADGAGHQVTTDGILVCYASGNTLGSITIKSDSASTPTTTRLVAVPSAAGNNVNATCPVKKNDYYSITITGSPTTTSYLFIPIS